MKLPASQKKQPKNERGAAGRRRSFGTNRSEPPGKTRPSIAILCNSKLPSSRSSEFKRTSPIMRSLWLHHGSSLERCKSKAKCELMDPGTTSMTNRSLSTLVLFIRTLTTWLAKRKLNAERLEIIRILLAKSRKWIGTSLATFLPR